MCQEVRIECLKTMYDLHSTQSKLVVRITVSMFSRAIPPNLHLSTSFTFESKSKLHSCHLRPLVSRGGIMIDKVYIINQQSEGDDTADDHNTTI